MIILRSELIDSIGCNNDQPNSDFVLTSSGELIEVNCHYDYEDLDLVLER